MVSSLFSRVLLSVANKIDFCKRPICATIGFIGGMKCAVTYDKQNYRYYYGAIGGFGGYIIAYCPFLIIPLPFVFMYNRPLKKDNNPIYKSTSTFDYEDSQDC